VQLARIASGLAWCQWSWRRGRTPRHASDRFDTALSAYRAGRAPLLVFGGGGTGVPGTPTEGEWNRRRATERGVPADAALAAGAARFTSDESASVAAVLHGRGGEGWLGRLSGG
jgi:hypothetical protein